MSSTRETLLTSPSAVSTLSPSCPLLSLPLSPLRSIPRLRYWHTAGLIRCLVLACCLACSSSYRSSGCCSHSAQPCLQLLMHSKLHSPRSGTTHAPSPGIPSLRSETPCRSRPCSPLSGRLPLSCDRWCLSLSPPIVLHSFLVIR